MHCVHNKFGCSWKGEVSELNAHLETCEFDLMDCPADCGNKVSHVVLQEHLMAQCRTKYSKKCEYCGTNFSAESETTHIETCILLPIPCPNHCAVGCVPRTELDDHLNEDCELNIQVCPFNEVGCKYESSLNKSSQHLKENLETHLLKLNTAFTQVQQTINKQNEENERLNTSITQIRQTVNKQNEENLKITAENKSLNTSITQIRQTVNKQNKENQKIKAENKSLNTSISQVRQTVNTLNQENERLRSGLSQLTLTVNKLDEENKKLKYEIERIVNQVTWVLKDFKETMRRAKNDTNFERLSSAFDFHLHGYKMRLELYLNGDKDSEPSHVSLHWRLLQGEFDDLLEWPFPYKVALTLIDQNSDPDQAYNWTRCLEVIGSVVLKKPEKQHFNYGLSYPEFISHEELYEGGNYIKDDKMIIKTMLII